MLVLVLVRRGGSARGDDPTETVRATSSSALTRDHDGPWLQLDPMRASPLEDVGAAVRSEYQIWTIGPGTRAAIEGTQWTSKLDVPGRGWRAGLSLSHDFGFAVLTASGAIASDDTRYQRGAYYELGLSLSRSHRFSKWVTAWIALSIGRRVWVGPDPPPGEENVDQITLSIGGTFR